MPYIPPSLVDLKNEIQTRIEAQTSQRVPSHDRAFKRVIVNALAMVSYPFFRFVSSQRRECFSISASEESLVNVHGPNEGITRGGATKCKVAVSIAISGNAEIFKSATFENAATGLRYFPTIDSSVSVGIETIDLIAENYGEEYALLVGDELELLSEIENVASKGFVSAVIVYPEDKQDLEDYRGEIIDSHSGSAVTGSTSYQYKKWGEAVEGVYRVFPFSGKPDDAINSLPGDRSVFVEAKHNLGLDGVPTSELLDAVKSHIRTKEGLGDTEGTLFINPISRIYFTVYVHEFKMDGPNDTAVKTAIKNAVSNYMKDLRPYVFGVDTEYGRNDKLSAMSIGTIIYNTLSQYGASATRVTVEEQGAGEVSTRTLIGGEIGRLLGDIIYVE